MFKRLTLLFKRHSSPSRLHIDRPFLVTTIVIIFFGLIMLSSASSIVAYNTYNDAYYFLKHQLISVAIGGVAFWLLSKFNYTYLRKFALPLLLISLGLLILVFIPGLGRKVNNSQSWITLLGFSVQPAEFVKLTFMIYLAALFEKHTETPKRFLSFIIVFSILSILMLLQPDPGTLIILGIASFTVYYLAGGDRKHILTLAAIGVLGLGLILMLPGGKYRVDRFRCFFDNNYSPDRYCYQLNQSLIAVGSGGIMGRGFGESRQKFLYLPEVQNDFIFAIIAEETGLVFSLLLICFFAFLFYRSFYISTRAPDGFSRNLSAGISIWLIIQVIINIGGIIGFLPLTGVPLPLVSYGGSAMMASLMGLGIIAGISKQGRLH